MDKKLKIAIIGSRGYPYVYSGYETLVKELSERLVKKGHNVTVYCHRPLFKKRPKNINGINLIYTPAIETKFLSQIVNSFFSFLHFCFSDNNIVLVVNSANGPFGFLTKIFRKKSCINVDGLEWLRPKWKGLGSIYFRFSSKLATIFFDELITDSFEMKKIYKHQFKKDSTVIAYGSSMYKTTKNSILKKYNLKKNQYYLIVGRLIPDNNSRLIIQGFIKSKSKKNIVIVGDVPYKDDYSKQMKLICDNDERLIMTGYVNCQDSLNQLYTNSYAYIHGHQYGGTNPSMVNALKLNLNILALNTKFNKEMLYKKKAVLFDKNIESIAYAINLFEKKYLSLVEKNRNYQIPEVYNWDSITEKYENIFFKIIKDRNRKVSN